MVTTAVQHSAKITAGEERLAAATRADGTVEYTPIHASRKALETPEHKFTDYPASYSKTSSGRRLALLDEKEEVLITKWCL